VVGWRLGVASDRTFSGGAVTLLGWIFMALAVGVPVVDCLHGD